MKHVYQQQSAGLGLLGLWTIPPRKDRVAKDLEKGFAPTLPSRIRSPATATPGAQSPWYLTPWSVLSKHDKEQVVKVSPAASLPTNEQNHDLTPLPSILVLKSVSRAYGLGELHLSGVCWVLQTQFVPK